MNIGLIIGIVLAIVALIALAIHLWDRAALRRFDKDRAAYNRLTPEERWKGDTAAYRAKHEAMSKPV